MAKKIKYTIRMKDGSEREVEGTQIIPDYAYDKRVISTGTVYNKRGEARETTSTTYCLTHVPTGTLITSSDKVNSLKLVCMEPEFFEEYDPAKLIKAVGRFWNRHNWQDPKVN